MAGATPFRPNLPTPFALTGGIVVSSSSIRTRRTSEACYIDGTEDELRLWEIAENLHRSDLTSLERSEHITEWVRLMDKKIVSGQLAHKPGRPAGGASEASRKIGVERTEVRRAVKIDSIAPEAKQAVREAGLDDNQSALLKIAAAAGAQHAKSIPDETMTSLSEGKRRDFRISVGLREGWDDEGRVFDVSEAVRTARAWMKRRVAAGQPALSGMFTRAEVTYAWPRPDGTVGSDREPVALFTGEAVHAYLGLRPACS